MREEKSEARSQKSEADEANEQAAAAEKEAAQATAGEADKQAAAAEEPSPVQPQAMKVLLQRGKDAEPVTCVTIEYKGVFQYWHPSPEKKMFLVDAITAEAAVRTGGFEVAPESKTNLKNIPQFTVEE